MPWAQPRGFVFGGLVGVGGLQRFRGFLKFGFRDVGLRPIIAGELGLLTSLKGDEGKMYTVCTDLPEAFCPS